MIAQLDGSSASKLVYIGRFFEQDEMSEICFLQTHMAGKQPVS